MRYLSDEDRQFVHEQAMRVLEEIGIAFNTEKAIDLLAAAGAPVDRETLRARLPRDLVEHCLATVPRRILLAGRDPRHDRYLDDGEPIVFCTDGTGTYMYDDVTGRRSEGTAADLRDVIRLFEGLEEVDMNWCSICPRDVDPATSGLRMAAIGLTESGKHLQDEVRHPRAGAGLRRDARDLRRRLAARTAHLLGHELHDRAAAARQGDDRGRHRARQGRRADLRHADAPHGHDRPDERARLLRAQHG